MQTNRPLSQWIRSGKSCAAWTLVFTLASPPICAAQSLFDGPQTPPVTNTGPSRVRGVADPGSLETAPYHLPAGIGEAPDATFGTLDGLAGSDINAQVQSSRGITPDAKPIEGSEIIARVDGQVLLASDLLWQINRVIAMSNRPVPPEHVAEAQQMLMQQLLVGMIDTKLLYGNFRATVPAEAHPKVETELAQPFEEMEIPRLMKMFGVEDRPALEAALIKSGTSIREVQRQFLERTIAGEWLRNLTPKATPISYEALLAYYQDHVKEYETPAQARWEELAVHFSRTGSRDEAWAQICDMGNAVWKHVEANPGLRGPVFGDVARAKSHGLTAVDGGINDWTTLGALRCEALNEALTTLAVGQMSDGIESEQGFHIVRVLERKDAGRVPFTEAQAGIRKLLEDEQRSTLRSRARVWTIYHGDMTGPRLAEMLNEQNKKR
jgi:hypothetical protein